jgi:hypothetical protein
MPPRISAPLHKWQHTIDVTLTGYMYAAYCESRWQARCALQPGGARFTLTEAAFKNTNEEYRHGGDGGVPVLRWPRT